MRKKHWWLMAAAAVLAAGLGAVRVYGFNPQPDPPAFSPIGVLPGETVRLAAWCAGFSPAAAATCSVEFQFMDINGRDIKTETLMIASGRGGFVELALPAVQSTPGFLPAVQRQFIIPCIRVSGRGLGVTASAEVYETSTGKTQYHSDGFSPAIHLLFGL